MFEGHRTILQSTKSMTKKEYLNYIKEKTKLSTHNNLINSKCGMITYGKNYHLIYKEWRDEPTDRD